MGKGLASMDGANVKPAPSIPGGWWLDGWPQRFVARWSGRGLAMEVGTRAYGCLTIEARRMFPPGLEMLEDLRDAAERQ